MRALAKWLYQESNHAKLWRYGCLALLLLVVLEFFIPLHAAFHAFEWIGFNAVYGFLSCVAMVLLAKFLGYIIKRPEDYYE